MTRYYRCGKAVSEKIRQAWKAYLAFHRERRKFCKDVGAFGYVITRGFGTHDMLGVRFPPETVVDPKKWVTRDDAEDGKPYYSPRRVKANKELTARMERLRSTVDGDVLKALGVSMFGSGLQVRCPGVRVCSHGVFVALDDEAAPAGVSRVSVSVYYSKPPRKEKSST